MTGLLTVALAGGAYAAFTALRKPAVVQSARTVLVSVGTASEKIAATGTVSATTTAALSFSSAGKVTELTVEKGQQVLAGDVLAKIDPTAATNALSQAKAGEATARARLQTLIDGLSPDERKQLAIVAEDLASIQTTQL